MQIRKRLFALFSTLLLSMCTFYDQGGAIVSPNGLSCQPLTTYGFFRREKSAQCYYRCPDGTIRQPEVPGEFSEASPLYTASQQDLNAQFCGGPAQPTPTAEPATASPAPVATIETPATLVPLTETPSTSATSQFAGLEQPPLLAGGVTMCDVGINVINFRMNEPVPDLAGKTLQVAIAGQDSTCTINPTNASLLTCTLPRAVTFPIRVVVHVDGALVNDFSFDGLGCAKIATPYPTTTP